MKYYNQLIFTSLFILTTACAQQSQLTQRLSIPDSNQTVGSIEIYEPQALSVLSPKAKISVRGEGYDWSEGPVWIDDGQFLLFSNIPENAIHKFDPKTGTSVYLKTLGLYK